MTSQPRIHWKTRSGFGYALVGYLGKHHVCSIYYKPAMRGSTGSYALSFNLPSINNGANEIYSENTDDLKEKAEGVLTRWISDAGIKEER